jgi:transcription initiation factor TFIID subunit 12
MSTNGSNNKRKPTDQSPDSSNSPALKHLKLDENPTNPNTNITAATMSSVPAAPRLSGLTVQQQQILQAALAQPNMPEDQKRKYITGIEQLKNMIEAKGPTSPEGQAAQGKLDKVFVHLRTQIQQRQQQILQQNQQAAVPAGAGVAGNAGATSAAGSAGINMAISAQAQQRWIPPPNVPAHQVDAWRVEISNKISGIGQKLSQSKAQVLELQQAIERGGHSPDQEAELRKKLATTEAAFNQYKEVLLNFHRQQKQLQHQRDQQQRQQQQQQAQQQQAQQQQQQMPGAVQQQPPQQQPPQGVPQNAIQMPPGGQQQQQPQPPPQQPQPHPAQQGMVPGHPQQQQTPQNMQAARPPPAQAPPAAGQPMQQQPQMQQPIPPQPVQRVATPVDAARANSPANVSSHVTTMNQVRQQQAAAMQPNMSPNPPNMQLPNQQQQPQQVQMQQAPQQQQQQAPQQPPQQQQIPRPGVPQPMPQQQPQQQVQQQVQQQQQQVRVMANSPAPGTPMAASPAPRPGSAQSQVRPPTATGTPVQGQPPQQLPPQQQQPQHPQQQQQRMAMQQAPAQRDTVQNRFPIPATLTYAPPTPAAIPPARPSLTGGANMPANQVLGTPAIIAKPSFEFDEGGMGLLSKRKLEELVKQIDPEEKLDPDVEEVRPLPPFPPPVNIDSHTIVDLGDRRRVHR